MEEEENISVVNPDEKHEGSEAIQNSVIAAWLPPVLILSLIVGAAISASLIMSLQKHQSKLAESELLNNKIGAAKKKVAELEIERQSLSEKVDGLRPQLTRFEEQKSELELINSELSLNSSKKENLKEELLMLQTKEETERTSINNLSIRLEELNLNIEDAENTEVGLIKQISKYKRTLGDVTEIENNYQIAQMAEEKSKREFVRLQDDIEGAERSQVRSISLKTKAEKELKKLEMQITQKTNEVIELDRVLISKRPKAKVITDSKNELSDLTEKLRLAAIKKKSVDDEIAELKLEIKTLNQEKEPLAEIIAGQKAIVNEHLKLSGEIAYLNAQLTQSTKELSSNTNNLNRIKNELKVLEPELNKKTDDLSKALRAENIAKASLLKIGAEQEALGNEKNSLLQKIAQQKQEITGHNNAIEELNGRIGTLKGAKSNLEKEIEELKKQLPSDNRGENDTE